MMPLRWHFSDSMSPAKTGKAPETGMPLQQGVASGSEGLIKPRESLNTGDALQQNLAALEQCMLRVSFAKNAANPH